MSSLADRLNSSSTPPPPSSTIGKRKRSASPVETLTTDSAHQNQSNKTPEESQRLQSFLTDILQILRWYGCIPPRSPFFLTLVLRLCNWQPRQNIYMANYLGRTVKIPYRPSWIEEYLPSLQRILQQSGPSYPSQLGKLQLPL